MLALVSWSAACTPVDNDGADVVAAEPVAECVQYEKAMQLCHHSAIAIANQPALIPHTRAEAAQIRELCGQNLARITTACR